jgi:hypothetical protein
MLGRRMRNLPERQGPRRKQNDERRQRRRIGRRKQGPLGIGYRWELHLDRFGAPWTGQGKAVRGAHAANGWDSGVIYTSAGPAH